MPKSPKQRQNEQQQRRRQAAAGQLAPQYVIITTTAIPSAVEDAPYAYLLQGYTVLHDGYALQWGIQEGALPAGLFLSENGQITGTPTDDGSAAFKVRLTATPEGADPVGIIYAERSFSTCRRRSLACLTARRYWPLAASPRSLGQRSARRNLAAASRSTLTARLAALRSRPACLASR